MTALGQRVGAIGAILFAVCFFVAMTLIDGPGGTFDADDVADWADKDHVVQAMVGLVLLAIGAAGLIRFAAACSARMENSMAGHVLLASAAASAAAAVIGGCMWTVGPVSTTFGEIDPLNAQTLYFLGQVGGTVMFGATFLLMASMWFAMFAGGRGAFPSWVRWGALAATILCLVSMLWLPIFLVLIWILAVGVWMLMAAGTNGTDAAANTTTRAEPTAV